MKKIPILVPARNEASKLEKTVVSIRNAAQYAGVDATIVVVDDGSHDGTAEVAKNLGCHVVVREDRGYSALGKPELADTHNDGFAYIEQQLPDHDYLMVIGADTTLEDNYIKILVDEMEQNPKLAIAAGILDGRAKPAPHAVAGSGRIIRRSFWRLLNCRVPNNYYSWESYPLVYAYANGFETRSFESALSFTSREPNARVDWKRYGIGMQEAGSIFFFVLLRAFRQIVHFRFRRGVRLIMGYLFGTCEPYPAELQTYQRSYQWQRIGTFVSWR